MLHAIKKILGNKVHGTDGDWGKLHDVLFQTTDWRVRYLEVDAGHWLTRRRALISPYALLSSEWPDGVMPVRLTKEALEKSPAIVKGETITRQRQVELDLYYGWPMMWADCLFIGPPFPTMVRTVEQPAPPEEPTGPHLTGLRQLFGRPVKAADGPIGQIDDWVIDVNQWIVRYAIVSTHGLASGGKVILPVSFMETTDGEQAAEIEVNLPFDKIRHSPQYFPAEAISRDYEQGLCDYYQLGKYWEEEPVQGRAYFLCSKCGKPFPSRFEQRLHQKDCRAGKKSHHRRRTSPKPKEDIVSKIEELRPDTWGGYRQTDRSS